MNRTVSWRESRRSFLTGSLAKEEASFCVSRRRSLPYAFRAGSCRFNCIRAFCICSCRLADKDRRRGTRIAFSITRSDSVRRSCLTPTTFFRSDPASSVTNRPYAIYVSYLANHAILASIRFFFTKSVDSLPITHV